MKKLYCFISSTFKDMQLERDLMKRIVMPTINQELMKYGISMQCIDLRWGIDTRNLSIIESQHKVLSSCYSEIKKSRPYFISFIGDYYGSLIEDAALQAQYYYGYTSDKNTKKSITELEIDYARELYEDHSKILFCIKKEGNSTEGSENKERLIKLKNKIKEEYGNKNQIIEYDYQYSQEKGKKILSNNLKDEIVKHILDNIDYTNYNIPENVYDVNNNYFNSIINNNNEGFAGREEETSKILNFINSSKHKLLTIIGQSGIGKTFLISNLIKTLEAKNIKHAKYLCGINDNTILSNDVVRHIIYQLNNNIDINELESITVDNFIENITKLSIKEKTCLIIDAVEQLKNPLELLRILNTFSYSSNIKIIITTTTDFKYLDRLNTLDREKLLMSNLKLEDAKQVFDNYFIAQRKDKMDNVKETLFRTKKEKLIANPIYLSLIIQKLNNLSYFDFNKIYKMDLEFNQALENYLLSSIGKTSDSIEKELDDLKLSIIKEIESGQEMLDFMSIAEEGISYDEIEFILSKLNKPYLTVEYSNFLKMCDSFVSEYDDGYWRIKHKYIKNYYYNQIKKDSSYIDKVSILSEYYSTLQNPNKQIFYLLETNNYSQIIELINQNFNNIEFIKIITNKLHDIDYQKLIVNLLQIDHNDIIIKFIEKIINENYLDYSISQTIVKIIKNKDLRIPLLYNAYYQRQYRQAVKIISKLRKEKIDLSIEIREIELLSKLKYKTVNIKKIYKIIEERGEIYSLSDEYTIKQNAVNYINSIKTFHYATNETKLKSLFFTYGMYYSIYNMLCLFNNEEQISIISDCFLFLSNRMLTNFYIKKYSIFNKKEYIERIEFENKISKELKQIIDNFINSNSSNIKLKAHAAYTLAKYCDNYEIEDDFKYAIISKNLYKEIFEKEQTSENIKNYALALDMKLDNDEMLGKLENPDEDILKELKDMIIISKQLVFFYPTTENYDILEDAYRRAKKQKKQNIYSQQDYQDEKEHHLFRKSKIKYEMSQEKSLQNMANNISYSFLIIVVTAISLLLIVYNHVVFKPIKEVDLMVYYLVISIILNILLLISVINILNILIDKKYKLHYDYLKVIINSIILIVSLILINSDHLLMSKENFDLYVSSSFYFLGNYASSIISIILSFIIIAGAFINKIYLAPSDIKNYQTFVLNYKLKIMTTLFYFVILLFLTISFNGNMKDIESLLSDNDNVMVNLINITRIIFSLLILLYSFVSLCIVYKRSIKCNKKYMKL